MCRMYVYWYLCTYVDGFCCCVCLYVLCSARRQLPPGRMPMPLWLAGRDSLHWRSSRQRWAVRGPQLEGYSRWPLMEVRRMMSQSHPCLAAYPVMWKLPRTRGEAMCISPTYLCVDGTRHMWHWMVGTGCYCALCSPLKGIKGSWTGH